MDEIIEEWRLIPGYESRYSASSLGRIRREPEIMNGSMHPDGYRRINLSHGSVATIKQVFTHVAVAEAFLGLRPAGMVTNHKDGNKSNNLPDNLEYLSPGDNTRHAHAAGLCHKGAKIHNAKLTEEQALAILTSPLTDSVLSDMYGVSKPAIDAIRSRRNWRYLVGEKVPHLGRGELRKDTKLTEEKVREIRASTEGERVLGRRYGVTPAAIYLVRQRKSWKHVQ